MPRGGRITGVGRVSEELKKLRELYPERAKMALRVEGEEIMTDSKENYVPVDLGALRNSGFVEEVEGELAVRLVYGGPAAPYAEAVHEHPSDASPPSWEGKEIHFSPDGRGPKYLEKPLNAKLAGMDKRVAQRIKHG